MLWICLACTTGYSVGAQGCPHCGSAEYAEEGTEMPKISRHGGASNKNAPAPVAVPAGAVDGEFAAEFMRLVDSGPVDVTGFASGGIVSPGTTVVGGEPAGTQVLDDGPYVVMLRADLQELCRARGLPTSGNKEDLVARLIADDEQNAL